MTDVVQARSRADLAALQPGSAVLAGGSWLFSEPQDHIDTLVDITTLGWPALTSTPDGLEIAATCTLAELESVSELFAQCCRALLASWKIRSVATVGGNLCLSLPAGAIIAGLVALDAEALVWSADSDRRSPVRDFVTGPGTNILRPGDVLRSLTIPAAELEKPTAFRKIALAPLGRSGAVVVGTRAQDGSVRLTVTGSTVRPVVTAGSVDELDESLWFDDPHGSPEWRKHVTGLLAAEIVAELR